MTAQSFDRALGRTVHMVGGILSLCAVAMVAYILGAWSRDAPWPYEVRSRKLLTSYVPPGGHVVIERVTDYHEDCNIRYERRVQSMTPGGRRFMLDDQESEHPPWDRSGLPQQIATTIPADFPCGPAYLVESVSVACTVWQRLVARRKKPDVITPFTVTGCPPP